MKAIDTNYNGYRFRSRLEARWAVYFDNLNIEYLYEHEGFVLPSGKHYLPDFYLPQHEFFCEVKPFAQEDERWNELVLHTNKPLILLAGEPSVSQLMISTGSYEPGKINRCEGTIIPRGFKYFPFFYVDYPYSKGDQFDLAVKAAKSKRFEFDDYEPVGIFS